MPTYKYFFVVLNFLMIFPKNSNPVNNVGVNTRPFLKFISNSIMGNWVKGFQEVKTQNAKNISLAIKPCYLKVPIIWQYII